MSRLARVRTLVGVLSRSECDCLANSLLLLLFAGLYHFLVGNSGKELYQDWYPAESEFG